jgi:predicted dehydrogenase
MDTVKIGIIGCGNISGNYFRTARNFSVVECVACADALPERAAQAAAEYGIPRACSVNELLAMPEISIVVNLTNPQAHKEISLRAIAAGKHVFTEKPLAVNRTEGAEILAAAQAAGVRVGAAPSTPLGGGLQTCRRLLDEGAIGQPIAASAFMMSRGHEHWHPNPDYYYQPGAGPMFDMGPYYLTALTTLLGPVNRQSGAASILIGERTITSEPLNGQKITVNTPDHVAGTLEFANGAIGTIITTFATYASKLPRIEIYGTEGTLGVPDPNTLGGPVLLARGRGEWEELPLSHGHTVGREQWGMGVVDMAHATLTGRAHRQTGAQAYHVLDLMQGFLECAATGAYHTLESRFERPAPLPLGLAEDLLD